MRSKRCLWFDACCAVGFTGIEDGQTVRMPVGNKEIFITFRVSCDLLYFFFCSAFVLLIEKYYSEFFFKFQNINKDYAII